VKYVSPSLEAAQRALTVEALVPNANGVLKPGLFATARIQQPQRTPGVLVPAAAVQTSAGTSRLYVVNGDHVEERIVTTGIIGAPAASADDEGPPAQMRVTQQLDRCVERIHIEMCDEAGCHLRLCSNATVIRYVCRQH